MSSILRIALEGAFTNGYGYGIEKPDCNTVSGS